MIMEKIITKKVFIVDDHQMIIDGIKLMIEGLPQFCVVGESNSPLLVVSLLENLSVDILITDVEMPGMSGIGLSRAVKKCYPSIKILALTAFNESQIITEMIAAGISGYIIKNAGRQILIEALNTIADGTQYFGQDVTLELAKSFQQNKEEVKLTNREIEIIRFIEKDMTNKEIAATLFISERTVETHRKNILFKTNTHTVIGLLKYAYERKIV